MRSECVQIGVRVRMSGNGSERECESASVSESVGVRVCENVKVGDFEIRWA